MKYQSLKWVGRVLGILVLGCALTSMFSVQQLQPQLSLDTAITKDFVMGKFKPEHNDRFMVVPSSIAVKAMYLQRDVVFAFQRMNQAALAEGIDIKIISGTRNFWQQKAIWERKWTSNTTLHGTGIENARQILRFSSMPGSSRHHWGTDIDINSLEPGYFRNGRGLREITWLRKHAAAYGFCEVYSPRSTGRTKGYEPEAWHWSYLPLANQYLNYYSSHVTYADFSQFYGNHLAANLKIIEDFAGGVQCK